VEGAGGQLVYQSHETSPIVLTKRPHPAGTNPLIFKRTCLFRFEDQEQCEDALQPGVMNQLQEVAGELSVQLYQRVPRSQALPAVFRKLLR
jgi:hypothetical protein